MATGKPDKAWLRRILTPRTATLPLPAPERRRENPCDEARPRASAPASDAPPVGSKRPAKPAEASPLPLPPLPPSPRVENVGPGKGREIKESERLASLHAALIQQAKDISAGMPDDAPEEARAELSALWRRIGALGELIEQVQSGEAYEARLAQLRRGEERER